jgi:polar amino acid transport system ATP-binding protein
VSILVDLRHLRFQFTRVSKAFGSSQVLIDLDFDIMDGEKVILIGPSGSGKTTVLRLAITSPHI